MPPPTVDNDAPFSMLTTLLERDNFLGRMLTGKVYGGKAKVNANVKSMGLDGVTVETFRLTKLLTFDGIERIPATEVVAGDIICVAGMVKTSVADTICDPAVSEPIRIDAGRSADHGRDDHRQ